MKLNIGCGKNILEGWVNIDCVPLPGVDRLINLEHFGPKRTHQESLGEESSVDEILASHVIEHISNVLPLMQELHRVSKPGAKMTIRVPHGASNDADEDPTHVRRMFPGSFGYYSQPFYHLADYGYRGDWRLLSIDLNISKKSAERTGLIKLKPDEVYAMTNSYRNVVAEMIGVFECVKPIREQRKELMDRPAVEINFV